MTYYIDTESVSLDDLRKRIEGTDLVPSRTSLLDGIRAKTKLLKQQGITTLASLRRELKNSRRLEALSAATGIEKQYLVLLRREVEGYFPKPSALKSFDWLPEGDIARLVEAGIRHTASLYEAACSFGGIVELADSTDVEVVILEALVHLADLSRVQWVSPTVARMLVETGCESASALAAVDAGELYQALVRVNEEGKFFKGKIGLRDIKRLINAACYVLNWAVT